MKILLVNPDSQYNPLTGDFVAEAWLGFPLNILYLAAGVSCEYEVEILDLKMNQMSSSELCKKLLDLNPDVVGISGWIDNYPSTEFVSLKVKELLPAAKLVIGGPFATVAPEIYLQKCKADAVMAGNGQPSLNLLLNDLENKNAWIHIPGINFLADSGEMVSVPKGKEINLPCVTEIIGALKKHFSLSEMEKYVGGGTRFPGKRGMMVMGSFGCPHNCRFCSPRYLGRYCTKSLFDLEAEIRFLMDEYGIDLLYFADPTFNLNQDHTISVCQIMKKFGIQWYAEGRVDKIDPELASIMADSGCIEMIVGIESFDQKILSASSKGTTSEEIYAAVRCIKDAGIEVVGFVLFGLPEQTEEEIDLTVAELRRLKIKVIPNLLFPLPGTVVWEYAEKNGQAPDIYQMVKYDFPEYNRKNRLHPIANLSFASDQKLIEAMEKIEKLNNENLSD